MNYIFMLAVFAAILAVLGIASFTNFSLDNYHYDRLKWVVARWSYFVVFIGVIVKTFDIPYGVETVTLVAAFGAMLAGLMNISNSNFNGVTPFDIDDAEGGVIFDGVEREEGDE